MSSLDLRATPYWFSGSNVFLLRGCDSSIILRNETNTMQNGCSSLCSKHRIKDKVIDYCLGEGCCKFALKGPLDFYRLNVSNTPTNSYNCTGTIVASNTYLNKFHDHYRSHIFTSTTSSAALGWMISEAIGNDIPILREQNVSCIEYHYPTKL